MISLFTTFLSQLRQSPRQWLVIFWLSVTAIHPVFASDWQLNSLSQRVEPCQAAVWIEQHPHVSSTSEVKIIRVNNVDHVNPFSAADYLSNDWELCYDSLIIPDPLQYGIFRPLMARNIQHHADQHTWEITIHPHATFANGEGITADDVCASLIHLIQHGPLAYHYLSEKNLQITATDNTTLTIQSPQGVDFDTLIQLGLMPITQKKHLASTHPPASGGYTLDKIKKNHLVQLKKNQNYWAKFEPIRHNMYYFDIIKIIFMKTHYSAFEAFKRGDASYRWEGFFENSQQLKKLSPHKKIRIKEVPIQRPIGMNGLAFNQHKPYLRDLKVRQALLQAFDFESINKTIFQDQNQRLTSYFTNTPFQGTLNTPTLRFDLEEADRLLNQQGWIVKEGKRCYPDSDRPVTLYVLISNLEMMKVTNIYKKQLEQLGITLVIQLATQADYLHRLVQGDFDLAYFVLPIGQRTPATLLKKLIPRYALPLEFSHLFGINDANITNQYHNLMLADGDEAQSKAHLQSVDHALMAQTLFIPFWYAKTDRFAHWIDIDGPDRPMQVKPKNNFQYWWPVTSSPLSP